MPQIQNIGDRKKFCIELFVGENIILDPGFKEKLVLEIAECITVDDGLVSPSPVFTKR